MTGSNEDLELRDRLSLIETMIAEGRRSAGSWAWTFVFWGVAYYVAIAWTAFNQWPWAWLITMTGASAIFWIYFWKQKRASQPKPQTTVGRAIFSVWICMGISMTLLFPALGFSGRFNQHIFVAIIAAMLGVANGASGMMIRWKAQIASAMVWWAASAAACFGSDEQCVVIFLVAIFLCQIVFGVYAMSCEARARRLEAQHA